LDFRTRLLAAWIAQVALGFTFGKIGGNAMGGLVVGFLVGGPSSYLLVKLADKFGEAGSSIFSGKGKEAAIGYSTENAMAQRGERDEACEILMARGLAGDNGALHAVIVIASKGPVLGTWVVKAAQILLRSKDLSEENKEHYTRLIDEYSRVSANEP
jgi:hypothetical protein